MAVSWHFRLRGRTSNPTQGRFGNPTPNPPLYGRIYGSDKEQNPTLKGRISFWESDFFLESDFLVTRFKNRFEILVGDTPSDFSE